MRCRGVKAPGTIQDQSKIRNGAFAHANPTPMLWGPFPKQRCAWAKARSLTSEIAKLSRIARLCPPYGPRDFVECDVGWVKAPGTINFSPDFESVRLDVAHGTTNP